MNILFFDTETTGIPPQNKDKSFQDPINYSYYDNSRLVEIAWQLVDKNNQVISSKSFYVKIEGFTIPEQVTSIHGITNETCYKEGVDILTILDIFHQDLLKSDIISAYNVEFDRHIILSEIYRQNLTEIANYFKNKKYFCSMKLMMNFLQTTRWISLKDAYVSIFKEEFKAHKALDDVIAMVKCYSSVKNYNVDFGKYKNEPIQNLLSDKNYCRWVINSEKFKDVPYYHIIKYVVEKDYNDGFDIINSIISKEICIK